jgi:Bacterial Ig-like domain (group 3)
MTASPARADTAPTSTTLTLSTNTVFSGLEDLNQLSVDVSGGNGSPAGSFGVFIGQRILCSGAVTGGSGACSLTPSELSPGTYPLTAIYSGDENSGASASNTVNLTVVAQQPTTTTLTLSAPTVTFGREQADQLNVDVRPVLAGIPTGTVTITAGSATVCTITLDEGDDSCTLTATQLPVGSYQLTATYGGGPLGQGRDGTFAGSASAAQALTVVALQPTTTSLTLSAPSAPFGNEQTETLTATVMPATGGTPTGTVTVASGTTPVCIITLAGGTGKCTLTGSQLAIGSYPLSATYNGDNTDAVSSDTSQTLTVAKEPTTTSLTLSADTIAHGSEQAGLFTVQVVPATSGTPAGNVTVKAGATAVCTIILANGTGNCSLTANQLKRGTYQITATYNGDTTYAVSTSTPPQTLNVVAK